MGTYIAAGELDLRDLAKFWIKVATEQAAGTFDTLDGLICTVMTMTPANDYDAVTAVAYLRSIGVDGVWLASSSADEAVDTMRADAAGIADVHAAVKTKLNAMFAGNAHAGDCPGAPPGPCLHPSHATRAHSKVAFTRLFEFLEVEENPALSGRFLAFFSQCAEDNAAVALIDYLTAQQAAAAGALNSVHVDGYSTFVSGAPAAAAVDGGLRHLDLCPVCKAVFAGRLVNAVKRALSCSLEWDLLAPDSAPAIHGVGGAGGGAAAGAGGGVAADGGAGAATSKVL